mmetsp:Transcript_897/g.2531  ORF Transcript_897/g.2531 Transcript_897/m.2531 type:complete len:423 (-) Transcript_897:80-1348(-)
MLARRVLSKARALSTATTTRVDVAVIGGGVIGSWAAINAAKRGRSVCLIEQFARGHDRGSSHGDGRIWRKAYEEDVYVDMMEQSLELWAQLQDTERPLLARTGMLCLEDASSPSMLEGLVRLFQRRGVPFESLAARDVRERFSQYRNLPDDVNAVHLGDAGVLRAGAAVLAAWRFAESLGVHTLESATVVDVSDDSKRKRVHVVRRQQQRGEKTTILEAGAVVLAPGAWLSTLAARFFQVDIPTRVTAELVSYHAAPDDFSVEAGMPVFSARCDNGLGPHGFYGLPRVDVQGVKVSAHHCGHVLRDPTDSKDDGASVLAANERFVERLWGGDVSADVVSTQRCLYTASPDHDYVLGAVAPHCVVAGAGSGHAFKNAPALGDAAACLALGLPPPFDVSHFAPDRPALQAARGHFPVPTAAKCK